MAFVCRCCWEWKEVRSPENPNVCDECEAIDWSDLPEPVDPTSLDSNESGQSKGSSMERPAKSPPMGPDAVLDPLSITCADGGNVVQGKDSDIGPAGSQVPRAA